MAAFILFSNCLSNLSLWLFVFGELLLAPQCSTIHQCHTEHHTSARALRGMPWAVAFLMVPVGLAHCAVWVALWKLLLVFTRWVDKCPVSLHVKRGTAALTSDFNVVGDIMALSLCWIVNSVTILWSINWVVILTQWNHVRAQCCFNLETNWKQAQSSHTWHSVKYDGD